MSEAGLLWVKICGNTSLADAQMAADAGADAVGFVFAPSPRRVTSSLVASITPSLPQGLEKIGVFVDATLNEVCSIVHSCGLTGVQLHSHSGRELSGLLRERLGPKVRILRVVHYGANAAETVLSIAADPYVDGVLVDSRTAKAVGGTGLSFDWAEARRTLFAGPCGVKLVAAGGLSPANVAEAIATLNPWGVDVVSGVEAEPGRKDAEKVRAFVENARRAARK
jgi:phosphoribosylanthranilate isomerase